MKQVLHHRLRVLCGRHSSSCCPFAKRSKGNAHAAVYSTEDKGGKSTMGSGTSLKHEIQEKALGQNLSSAAVPPLFLRCIDSVCRVKRAFSCILRPTGSSRRSPHPRNTRKLNPTYGHRAENVVNWESKDKGKSTATRQTTHYSDCVRSSTAMTRCERAWEQGRTPNNVIV